MAHLDKKLLNKIAHKLSKELNAIHVKVSQKAASLGISSEAALVLIAKELGIGTAHYQRNLEPSKQTEIRESLPTIFVPKNIKRQNTATKSVSTQKKTSKRNELKAAIEYLLEDEELRSRCSDILLARANFDRPINQATLILEDRIRTKAEPPQRLVGEPLVGYAFNAELSKTVLKVSDNAEDQRGFASIIKGVVPAFRNPTHHHVINKFTREEALKVCAFIDVLLKVVKNSVKV